MQILSNFINNFYDTLEVIGPKIMAAGIILFIGMILSFGTYKLTLTIFKKFGILDLIDKIWDSFEEKTSHAVDATSETNPCEKSKHNKTTKRVHYDRIAAKALSYYIFLVFFRWSIVIIGITEVEQFLKDVLNYLPSLFIGILIGYFGLRFANSVYEIIYSAMELTKQKTSKIIAMGAKIIIMFFTFMIMLNYIQIVDQNIINALFYGFITTITIAFGLAFGLGGKDIAREILEGFRK